MMVESLDLPPIIRPQLLRRGDVVRLVSPASPVSQAVLDRAAEILSGWDLQVEFADHVLARSGYLAGSDGERLADLDAAFRDPNVRAVIATRGGKGSYRIADQLDFNAMSRDPKWLVGFSDITILQLALQRHCGLVCAHGAVAWHFEGTPVEAHASGLRKILIGGEPLCIASLAQEPTRQLTSRGTARGRLIGGNLDLIATAAGWALPDLRGAILLLECVDKHPGEVDRPLTMLVKGGHLHGVAGFAIGRLSGHSDKGNAMLRAILAGHLARFDVPVLGGLPVGHGPGTVAIRTGGMAELDADRGLLKVE
ncbi:LD-carboxypeptidase [Jiella endophytica]